MNFNQIKNRFVAKLFTAFPSLARSAATKVAPLTFDQTPWTPMKKPLSQCRMALVTTAGVHLRSEKPFDMEDSTGDPTFRVVPSNANQNELKITHNYYDHKDADRDINIVFPLDRLREFVDEGVIGSLAKSFYGFMGHIEENHIPQFIEKEILKVAAMMKDDGVDVALITPG